MLILDIAIRFLRETTRLRITAAILILMPAFMAGMFWFAFSNTGLEDAQTYKLVIVNNDGGFGEGLANIFRTNPNYRNLFSNSTLNDGLATDFIEMLSNINYSSSEGSENTSIFNVYTNYTESSAIDEIENRNMDALVIFNEDFTNATLSAYNNAFFIENKVYLPIIPSNDNSTISVKGDEGYARYQVTRVILDQIFSFFIEDIQSIPYKGGNNNIQVDSITLKKYSIFDRFVPGIYVFAALTQAGMLAAFLVDEIKETKTITRIKISLIKPYEYVAGVTIYTFIISFVQMSILFAFSMIILGFSPTGNIIEAMIILLLTTIFTSGLGFFLAGIFSNADTAGQSAGFLMAPLAFMSGAFMDIPAVTLISNFFPTPSGLSRNFILWDLLPTTHSVNSLRSVLLYGFSIFDVWAEMLFITVFGIIVLAFSMIFYAKRRFLAEIV